jgi:UDP-3-O-[3-hydroxymyristoyl] N-acetylglucosamine deacetylase
LSVALSSKQATTQLLGTRNQRTIKREVSIQGFGLFTGVPATLKLSPAKSGQGIQFQRTDLPGKPLFPAKLSSIQGTPRCTLIGNADASVQTVEHLLSALRAYEIDNLTIEITGPEVPILDGSSLAFAELIQKAEIVEQSDADLPIFKLSQPLFWSKGDIHIVAIPCDEYRISYTLSYPKSNFLRSQFFSTSVSQEIFKTQIAPCRTFSLYEEIAPLIQNGLIKGSLENGVIIKDDSVLNPEGLRFPDEMARHKILDMIGDLSLVGFPFVAHVIAIRSGHAANIAFARELHNHFNMEHS